MTLDEASQIVASHFRAHEVPQAGLDATHRATALIEGEQVAFEFDIATSRLRTSVLIYRWREWAVAGLLEALRREAGPGGSDVGGGELLYLPERKTLSLAKTYASLPTLAAFEREQARLREACTLWRTEVFARVAERVRHPVAG